MISPPDVLGRYHKPLETIVVFVNAFFVKGLQQAYCLPVHALKRQIIIFIDVTELKRKPCATFDEIEHQFERALWITDGLCVIQNGLFTFGNTYWLIPHNIGI